MSDLAMNLTDVYFMLEIGALLPFIVRVLLVDSPPIRMSAPTKAITIA